jgi:transcriptional regulator with XRE-family HTH domain
MNLLARNLKFLRARQGLTQKQLADQLGVKPPVIGAYEEGRALPPLPVLLKLADFFQVSLDEFSRTDLSKPGKLLSRATPSGEVLVITVDESGDENVELVSHKAAAGYLAGFQDPEFISELPKIKIPVLPRNRTIRAFEIRGDSMLPVQSGSIVFGAYVESLAQIKNGSTYILVTETEGIVFKRVYLHPDRRNHFLLVSDNTRYAPYPLPHTEVRQVWKAVGYYAGLSE